MASNSSYTHYHIHEKRGKKAVDDAGILPEFKGTAVHDNWATYYMYEDCTHATCNVHHLRELRAMTEIHKQQWAGEMTQLLLDAKTYSETNTYPLSEQAIDDFTREYDAIVARGQAENLGKTRVDSKAAAPLLKRFVSRQEEVLEFLHQKDVPFDNNLAERDVRMVKVKQKVSGTFRCADGAKHFARTRGAISTFKKQGLDVLASLLGVIDGSNPLPIT